VGPCGRNEDAAEDSFTSLVTTPRGNFRIIEGVWGSASFYLQRIANVLERSPTGGNLDEVRESAYALLSLSDLICERSELPRYHFGEPSPRDKLPRAIAAKLPAYRKRVTFSFAELRTNGLSLNTLAPFILDSRLRKYPRTASTGHSPLLQFPLLRRSRQLVVALPTAISVAIRLLVVDKMIALGLKEHLLNCVAEEYHRFFTDNPPLGTKRGAPIQFIRRDHSTFASYAEEIDSGRYLQTIFTLDVLDGFEATGFATTNSDPQSLGTELDSEIEKCRHWIVERKGFREGLTVIVDCGVGRGFAYVLPKTQRTKWNVLSLSAADASLLSLVETFDCLTLWRMIDAENRLAGEGVRIINVNGPLNLISWIRSLDGHLVRHSEVPEDFGGTTPSALVIDPSMVRELRMEVATRLDVHCVPTTAGNWLRVRKPNDSYFDEDRSLPLYISCEWDSQVGLAMVYLTSRRQWWCEIVSAGSFERWKLMLTWLPKLASVLDSKMAKLPHGALLLRVEFAGQPLQQPNAEAVTKPDIADGISIHVDSTKRLVAITTNSAFERGLANPTNVSEAALVEAVISGFAELAGKQRDQTIVDCRDEIIVGDRARSLHAFNAQHFRDFVRPAIPEITVGIDPIDDATLRLGLGWKSRNREDGSEIEGVGQCTEFLNNLVGTIEDDLCRELKDFDRKSTIRLALQNHEAAMLQQSTWRRTAGAVLSLRDNSQATMAVIADHKFKADATLLASRVLVELAVCECPLQGGCAPGRLDLARLLARLSLVISFGGWSDAIHYEAAVPSIEVTPLGDIHVDPSFFHDVVMPFGGTASNIQVNHSISRYATNFEPPNIVSAAQLAFHPDFVSAWKDEHGYTIDEFRLVVDKIEDLGIKRGEAVFTMRRSELKSLLNDVVSNHSGLVDGLTTIPRACWRTPAPGFTDKDRYPWRFRRRQSLLRRPFVQIDSLSDPTLMITPGLLRDAMAYSVNGYYEGGFPPVQLKSSAMNSWFGRRAHQRGKEFTDNVEERMRELGWKAEAEVAVTKILQQGFACDYGDVDVLCWCESTARILLLECKDLHFHKTPGELAEQLRDFRGRTHNGRRDLLRKHIERCDVLRRNIERLASYTGLGADCTVESWVIFRNPVPMLFAWKNLAVSTEVFDGLDRI